ncbi:MAG: DUF4874 domain-containing protein [Butyrivibrio sp.]|nr:DUF4874 domain-containing protein [Acetatifactor muris]MCM1559257.1 DUF4874 domain-containing protein [Butyrivibrio sp.]
MKFLEKLRKPESGWKLNAADLAERPEDVCNPCRGWYQIHTFQADEEPDFGELEWCLDRKASLALVFVDIGGFRDRRLDPEALDRIRRILSFFRDNQYDMILRVAYDHQGKAVEREPYFWDQVKEHMRQVGELLQEYGESIFIYQGLLTGNWGEMHTTRFQDEKKRKELWSILQEYRPAGTYGAVRRPAYWRQLHGEQKNGKYGPGDMGLFDDAMFASADHLGTFGTLSRENGWGEAWKREEELCFEEELCRSVPNGGEAVYGEAFQAQLTPKLVEDLLRRMHITYLNKVYDAGILDIWRQWKYSGAEAWNGKSLYDYIGAHLGYRLVIRDVRFQAGRGGDSGKLEITVENTGFASLYQETEFRLESGDAGNAGGEALSEEQPSGELSSGQAGPQKQSSRLLCLTPEGKNPDTVWNSGEVRCLSCNVLLKPRQLWLRANRKADGAVIRFANGCDKDGRTKIGELER